MNQDDIKKAQELSAQVKALGKSSAPKKVVKEKPKTTKDLSFISKLTGFEKKQEKKEFTTKVILPVKQSDKDTPEQIANKLNSLSGVLNKEVIKDYLTAEEVVAKLKTLQGNDRLDISNIRNGENLARLANGNFNMNDMRWHGSGAGQDKIQWQDATVNLGIPGQFTVINLTGGLVGSFSNNVLTIDATGAASNPAPPDKAVQYNRAGSFGGSANFTFDYTNFIFDLSDGGNNHLNMDPTTGITSWSMDTQFLFFGTGTNQTQINLDLTSHRITLLAGDSGTPLASTSLVVDFNTTITGVTAGATTFLLDKSSDLYQLGDIGGAVNGSLVQVDDGNQLVTTTAGSMGTSVDGGNSITFVGTNAAVSGAQKSGWQTDFVSKTLTGLIFAHKYLFLDQTNGLYQLGDIEAVGAKNYFTVDNTNSKAYYDNTAHTGSFGINTSTPAQNLDVVGTARISGSTGTTTTIMGRNGSGDVAAITVSTGLSLSGNILTATGSSGAPLAMSLAGSLNLTATTTAYNAIGAPTFNGTETNRQWICPAAGTIKNLYVVTDSAQPGTGSLVITLRKNASSQAVTLTIAAGSGAGTFSDTTHTFAVSAGDLVDFQYVNNASSASAGIKSVGYLFI